MGACPCRSASSSPGVRRSEASGTGPMDFAAAARLATTPLLGRAWRSMPRRSAPRRRGRSAAEPHRRRPRGPARGAPQSRRAGRRIDPSRRDEARRARKRSPARGAWPRSCRQHDPIGCRGYYFAQGSGPATATARSPPGRFDSFRALPHAIRDPADDPRSGERGSSLGERKQEEWEAAPAVVAVMGLQLVIGLVSRAEHWTLWLVPWWGWLIGIGPEAVLLVPLVVDRSRHRLEQLGYRAPV